jgi:hypothetical protein
VPRDSTFRLTRAELVLGGAGALAGVAGLTRAARLLEGVAEAATEPVVTTRDEPLAGGGRAPAGAVRDLAPRDAPPFTLLGLHWQGAGSVSFRVRERDGGWGDWQRAQVHELPDPDSAENRRGGWRLGTPFSTGAADAVQYRLEGEVDRLRAHFVWSPPAAGVRAPAAAAQPTVLPRSAWGADESIVRAGPQYADTLRFAVVHHTAGKSPATPAASAAIVRGIQVYHVESNGWNDIGYNFLVDPFGQVFEGRVGGTDRNVVGAHALGYNTGSVGVALLGNFENESVTAEAVAALVSLLAWRLDLGHVDPVALVTVLSSSGETRTLRAISGHRDVNATACPGATLFPQLDAIAQQAGATGLPKLYEPLAASLPPRAWRLTARLSSDLPWTVAVIGPDGSQVAAGSGAGAAVDWTWDASAAPDGRYAWTIAAPGVLPASGALTLGAVGPAPTDASPPPPRPARPGGIPRRIPRWAWDLRAWHKTPKAQRGPRPAGVPRRIPRWYWKWNGWLSALERWEAQYGSARALR